MIINDNKCLARETLGDFGLESLITDKRAHVVIYGDRRGTVRIA